jgi:hypothetical protein
MDAFIQLKIFSGNIHVGIPQDSIYQVISIMVIMQQLQKQDRRPFHGMVKAYGNIQQ